VSITYDDKSRPISAKILTLVYVPDCSFDVPLDRGEGSIVIIKTLLQYIYKQHPNINEFVLTLETKLSYWNAMNISIKIEIIM